MFFLVFALIRFFVWLVLLPFKILWEIAEHSGHRRHHRRRRRAPVRRNVPSVHRQHVIPAPQGPAGPGRWQSLPPSRKALIIALPLAFVLLIALGSAVGSPGPSSPPAQAPASGATPAEGVAAAPASGPALVRHHHKRHHRKHRSAVASPAPAPTSGSCHPIAASGKCYEPGEFCPRADAGMTGMAGDGEKIICADIGLRWKPA